MRGVAGFVERAVRDAVGNVAVAVFKLRDFDMIGLESEERGGAALLAGDGEPLEIIFIIAGLEQRFAIVIGRAIECLGADIHPPLQRIFPFEMNRPVTEKLDVRARHRRTARGIGDPPLLLAAHVVLDEH